MLKTTKYTPKYTQPQTIQTNNATRFKKLINCNEYKQKIKKRIQHIILTSLNYLKKNMVPQHQYNKKARPEDQKISRTLAGILRHKAVQVGLDIDAAGFIKVTDVIAYLKKKGFPNVDEAVLQRVVDTNDKKRFELQMKGKHLCIRATQGHSMKQVQSDQLLKKITDPTLYPVVIHGTFFKFWNLIKEEGLKRMSRNHIHFAPGMPKEDGVISGMRRTCDVYITIDMFAAIKDGIDFYISSNNVILTQGIDGVLPPKYFKNVVSSKGQDLLKREEMKKQQKEEEQRQNGHKKQKNNGKKKQKTNQKKQPPKEEDEQK